MEKIIKPISGFFFMVLSLAGIGFSIYLMASATHNGVTVGAGIWIGSGGLLFFLILLGGLIVINPNQARAVLFLVNMSVP